MADEPIFGPVPVGSSDDDQKWPRPGPLGGEWRVGIGGGGEGLFVNGELFAVGGKKPVVNTWDEPWGRVTPRYFDGDEWGPLASGADRMSIANLQAALSRAGYLSGSYREGTWDAKSATAMKALMGDANRSGMTWQDALLTGMSTYTGGGTGGGSDLPVRKISNPEELRAIFDEVGTRTIGRKLTEDEKARMVDAYHAVELAPQDALMAADPNTSPVVTEAPSPEVFADTELARTQPVEYGATQVGQRGQEFFELLNQSLPGGQIG